MQIQDQVVLISGANGGIGKAFVQAFVEAGAKTVYACARSTDTLGDIVQQKGVQAVALDITNPAQVEAAVEACSDVTILVNNAGQNLGGLLGSPATARAEMEVNYFGTLAMCTAFAPVLAAHGGGWIVNTISILAYVNMPSIGSYSASKAALHSLTQGLRSVLAKQGTKVVGLYPGPVETRLTEGLDMPKAKPAAIAQALLAGLLADADEIYPDPIARDTFEALKTDRKAVEQQFGAY
ncbi:MAG: SDR family oxidoreductase [bacterium]|jgi:NAD(P)-dependent dehydrogenase (short-subunit alcohol dehydrogenase family)|nr:SDR family oxidoreductase [bacterium]